MVGRMHSHKGCEPEATLTSLSCGPLSLAADNMAGTWLHQSKKVRKGQRECEQDGSHNLLYPSHGSDIPHFCCIPFGRSKSVGEGITRECDYQEARTIGSHFRSCLPQSPTLFPFLQTRCFSHFRWLMLFHVCRLKEWLIAKLQVLTFYAECSSASWCKHPLILLIIF